LKLISLTVNGFGRLENYSLSFHDGMNVFLHSNGWGKTTLCAFIKAMFYGLPYSRSTKGDDTRRRYQPWTAKAYGGILIFEYQDRVYRVERSFGKTPAGDKTSVYDEKTGQSITFDNIGERVFGIDSDAFSRCLFLPQEFTVPQATQSISERLMALLANTDGGRSDLAIKKLDEWRFVLSKTGKRGYIDELKAKRAELTQRKEEATRQLENIEVISRQLMMLEGEKRDIEENIVRYKELFGVSDAKKQLDNAVAALENKKKQPIHEENELSEIERAEGDIEHFTKQRKFFADSISVEERRGSLQTLVSMEERYLFDVQKEKEILENERFCFSRLPDEKTISGLEDKIKAVNDCREEIEVMENSMQEANESLSRLKIPERRKTPRLNVMAVAVSVIAVVFMALFIAGIEPQMVFLVATCASIAALIVVLFLISKPIKAFMSEKSQYDSEKTALETNIEFLDIAISKKKDALYELQNKAEAYLSEIGINLPYSDTVLLRFNEDCVKYASLTAEIARAESIYKSFVTENAADIADAKKYNPVLLDEMRENIIQLENRITDAQARKARAEAFISAGRKNRADEILALEKNTEKLLSEFRKTCEGVPEELLSVDPHIAVEQSNARLLESERLIAQKRSQIEHIKNSSENPDELDAEIALVDERIIIYSSKLTNVYRAMDFIKQAEINLSENYVPTMRERLKALIKESRTFSFEDILVDKDLSLSIYEKGAMRELKYFSRGTQTAMGFLMRIALMQSMYEGDLPFVVADDCFNDLDENNYNCVMALLEKLSQKTQIIYFNCYRSEKNA